MKTGKLTFLKGFMLSGIALLAACSSSRDTAASRGMQNLTARYNILYNARILIEDSERNISEGYKDDYTELIPVFEEPTEELAQAESKNLDKAIEKVQVIISEKAASQYVDDAYLLIAKASHLKAQYFNAAEFFDYLHKSYPDEKEKAVEAMAWKARSLMALGRFEAAEATLDSALKNLEPKSRAAADLLAARAQLHIYANEDSQAISLLKNAVRQTKNKALGLRWTFLLAQLEELDGRKEAALDLYTSVIRSNAPFDLAFNAQLNRIALQQDASRGTNSRVAKLAALLKDDKNRSFVDQIHHQIGKAYAEAEDWRNAVESFNAALRTNSGNAEQKGLTYLTLAELYFNQSRYPLAKQYYDSTLLVLPKTHRQYSTIYKKATNLDLLTSQLSIIAREDTLQMLAKLAEPEREERIAELVRLNEANNLQDASVNGTSPAFFTSAGLPQVVEGKFYFNNTAALSQGFSDFKRRWGNRKLEDNWRSSQKSSAQVASNLSMAPSNPDDAPAPTTIGGTVLKTQTDVRREYLQALPLSPSLLGQSNQRIVRAYTEIASFYRDILNDQEEAIATYEALLQRFPDDQNTPSVYYNLYRLYSGADSSRAEEVKKILLDRFPETQFAKIILDPEYGRRMNDQEAALTQAYNDVYELYQDRKYREVLSRSDSIQTQYPENRYSAQLDYLKALAGGHLQKIDFFENGLKTIVATYPADSLITPLVKQHLEYINRNRQSLANQPFAIMEQNPNEPRWVEEPETPATIAAPPTNAQKASTQEQKLIPEASAASTVSAAVLPDTSQYYFVVNVLDPSANLSSSRFGIGQFNRTRYAGAAIKHQLKNVNNQNQLIFVGPFINKGEAVAYYQSFMPLIKQIMKIPAERYNTFIITQENFGKLSDRQALEKYIEFYQNTLNERNTE